MYYTRHCNHNRLLFSTRYPRQPRSTETQTSDRWHQSYLCSYRLGKNSLYKGSHRGLGVRGCSRSVRKVHGRLWSIVQGARYSLSDSFHLKAICSTAAASNNAVICFTLSRKTSDVPDEWQHLLRCAVASQQSGTLIHKANWWQTYCRYGHTSPILEKLSLGERRGYDRGRKKKKMAGFQACGLNCVEIENCWGISKRSLDIIEICLLLYCIHAKLYIFFPLT